MRDSPLGEAPPGVKLNFAARENKDESVQAGTSSVFPGADHYLFDPNGDILYNAWSATGGISSRGSKNYFAVHSYTYLK